MIRAIMSELPIARAADAAEDPPVSLTDLMARIAGARDRAAFAALFSALAPRVKGYLVRMGSDDGTAEEITQDVMLTVWHQADRFDPNRAGLTTWIYTIARNRRIDRLRREQRVEFDAADPLLVADPTPSADWGIENAQEERRLRQAIDALPREQADLLLMSYYEDVTHQGIAEARNLPLGTVKSRIRLALERLRQHFGAEGER